MSVHHDHDHNHGHDCCSHVQVLQPDDLCACNSGQPFKACCQPFVTGAQMPATPEQLMRSRYTAYTQALVDYIADTMCGPAAQGFDKDETAHWAHHIKWHGLDVLNSSMAEHEGTVEFKARYEQDGHMHHISENSLFRRIRGRWFYVDTVKSQKLGRNDPCHCGSGKKYKKCCG